MQMMLDLDIFPIASDMDFLVFLVVIESKSIARFRLIINHNQFRESKLCWQVFREIQLAPDCI